MSTKSLAQFLGKKQLVAQEREPVAPVTPSPFEQKTFEQKKPVAPFVQSEGLETNAITPPQKPDPPQFQPVLPPVSPIIDHESAKLGIRFRETRDAALDELERAIADYGGQLKIKNTKEFIAAATLHARLSAPKTSEKRERGRIQVNILSNPPQKRHNQSEERTLDVEVETLQDE